MRMLRCFLELPSLAEIWHDELYFFYNYLFGINFLCESDSDKINHFFIVEHIVKSVTTKYNKLKIFQFTDCYIGNCWIIRLLIQLFSKKCEIFLYYVIDFCIILIVTFIVSHKFASPKLLWHFSRKIFDVLLRKFFYYSTITMNVLQ